MAQSLAQQIASAPGQPSSVRIGRVNSTSPTVITAQGVEFNDVGFLGSYVPTAGDVVALLGQSSQAGSDPASWLCLGSINSGPVAPRVQAGSALFTFVAQTVFSVDIVFAIPFEGVPAVTCTIANNAGVSSGWFVRTGNNTNTGVRISVNTLGAAGSWTNIPVHWHAVEMTQ